MKINERLLKKLIKESLTQNLLFERASDKQYDIISSTLVEVLKNPKKFLHAHGRLGYADYVKLDVSRGEKLIADLDSRYQSSEYSKILILATQYYSLKRYVPNLSASKKIFWLEDIEEDFLNKFSKNKGSTKNLNIDIKPLYAFTINRSAINTIALKLHKDLDGFMKMGTILKFLKDLKFVLYPEIENAGGSMSSTGTFNFNCIYYRPMFQKIRPIAKPPEVPPPPPPPPPPKSKLTENTSVNLPPPPSMESLIDPVIKSLNDYGYERVMRVLSWLYVKDETFLEYLEKIDLTAIISHEIGHFINAVRAEEKSGNVVHYRDSGLKNYKSFTVGTKGYQLSTEELQARYIELRNKIKTDINKIINFNSVINSKNKTDKEKQSDFLRGTSGIFSEKPELNLFYKDVFSLLFNGQKSKAVNYIIKGKKTTIPAPPGTNFPPTVLPTSNFIKDKLLRTAGQDESIWETKKGKQYLGRVYNRIVDLVDFIDDILEDNGLK